MDALIANLPVMLVTAHSASPFMTSNFLVFVFGEVTKPPVDFTEDYQ
jgi:hypothetical protein